MIVTLAHPNRTGAQISLATHDRSAPVVPNISVQVDDVDAAHQSVQRIGARPIGDPHVFADPAGHPFCLIPRPVWAAPVNREEGDVPADCSASLAETTRCAMRTLPSSLSLVPVPGADAGPVCQSQVRSAAGAEPAEAPGLAAPRVVHCGNGDGGPDHGVVADPAGL